MSPPSYYIEWYGAPAVMAGVSAAYYFAYRGRPAYGRRLLCAAHGVAGVALYFGALALWASNPVYRPSLAWPYATLYLLPLALIVVALIKFTGPKLIHLLQLPNLCAMYWSLFVGGMAVTGDWL
jgi:hypothetical protein